MRPEIYAYGFRNPWRFSFDRVTGQLLLGDVGQDDFEEIDATTIAAARGANFGWPRMEGLHCFPKTAPCATDGLTLPSLRVSACGRLFGDRRLSLPRHTTSVSRDLYFYGDWCSGTIWGATEEAYGQWLTRAMLGERTRRRLLR